jgi:glycogen debranching enzyme
VRSSIRRHFAPPDLGYLADCLHATRGQPARGAQPDDTLRPNQLLAITLGAVRDPALCAAMLRACEDLLVPGAIRSLADRPVTRPLPIAHRGSTLNDPLRPYWGHYRGDEDTRRKPAYHNGTAWTWLFPSYAEALVMTFGPAARPTALSLLGSSLALIDGGCVGHVPEILDGDAPHLPRGCGAQAWGASELHRVLTVLTPEAGGADVTAADGQAAR